MRIRSINYQLSWTTKFTTDHINTFERLLETKVFEIRMN